MANKQWSIMRCIEMKRLNLYSWNSACINALRTFNTHFCYLFFCNLRWLKTTVFLQFQSSHLEWNFTYRAWFTIHFFCLHWKWPNSAFLRRNRNQSWQTVFFRAFLLKWHRIIDSFVHLRLLFFLLICRRCTLICMLKYRFANASH